MSAQQSNLSAYGFDMVVATTQEAINATMKQYIHEFGKGASPIIMAYFVMDDTGNICQVPVGYPNNMSLVFGSYFGTDPLQVPAWNGSGAKPSQITTIQALLYNKVGTTVFTDMPAVSAFKYGVSFELGFPPGTTALPDVIPQISDDGQYVIYNLYFQNLTFTVANYLGDNIYFGMNSYEVYTQTYPGKVYKFSLKVPLATINDGSNLPDDVAARAAALGNAFTLQQLVLDLDQASWYEQPVISDAPANSEVYKMLSTVFLPLFAQMMAEYGRPALGFNFIPAATNASYFGVTDVQLRIDDSPNASPAPGMATLDYLCAVNGNQPQPWADFSDPTYYLTDGLPFWNWFDTPPAVHGVIAVSPSALGNYFTNALMDYVKSNCYAPTTSWGEDSGTGFYYCATPVITPGQTPTVSGYNGNGQLASFSYSSQPPAGYSQEYWYQTKGGYQTKYLMYQQLTPSYTLTVSQGDNNTIKIVQQWLMYYEVSYGGDAVKGNILNRTITDIYTLAVDPETGKYAPAVSSTTTDNPDHLSFSWLDGFYANNLNGSISAIESWASKLATTNFQDVPASIMQDLVFPGGNTFSLNQFVFSDYGDLLAYINYATPEYITK